MRKVDADEPKRHAARGLGVDRGLLEQLEERETRRTHAHGAKERPAGPCDAAHGCTFRSTNKGLFAYATSASMRLP